MESSIAFVDEILSNLLRLLFWFDIEQIIKNFWSLKTIIAYQVNAKWPQRIKKIKREKT